MGQKKSRPRPFGSAHRTDDCLSPMSADQAIPSAHQTGDEWEPRSSKTTVKRETLRERHLRERKFVAVQIEDAKARLFQKLRAFEDRITTAKRLPISPVQMNEMEQRRATIRTHILQGVMKVYEDRDATFNRLLQRIEDIEMQQSASSSMDWEELDDLIIVRMMMFYSQIRTELVELEVQITAFENRYSKPTKAYSVESTSTMVEALLLSSQAERLEGSSSPSEPRETVITIDTSGGRFNVSRSVSLWIPPNTVTQSTAIKSTMLSKDFLPSPAENIETTVSHIVGLGPQNVYLQRPIIAILLHSGPGREYGYETIVKAFNQEQLVWEELKECESSTTEQSTTTQIRVKITKLTILAVVSRLTTDRFEVTPKGCVVRSSVCEDIMLHFPEGAATENINGSLKVLMMPKDITTSGYPCPVLFVNGFEDIRFLNDVVVQIPHPCPAIYPVGEIHLMCLEKNQWKDVTNQSDRVVCVEHQSYIELHVQHFSGLWPWLNTVASNVLELFQYLCHSPQAVCFAAFKEKQQMVPSKITLLCVSNHDEERMQKMKDDGYSRLARNTARNKMRPNDKAYMELMEGPYEIHHTDRDFFLQFLPNESYIAELSVRKKREQIQYQDNFILLFYSNKEHTEDEPICKLDLSENTMPQDDANIPQKIYNEVDSDEEQGDTTEITSRFGAEDSLLTISADKVARELPIFLKVHSLSQEEPPSHIMKKSRIFCRMLKKSGRKDIVEALRHVLPAGMTGPISDGNTLVKNMECDKKKILTRHLSRIEEWKPLAEQLGASYNDMMFFEARTNNHAMAILDQYGAHLTVNQLYKLLVKIGANAIADYL